MNKSQQQPLKEICGNRRAAMIPKSVRDFVDKIENTMVSVEPEAVGWDQSLEQDPDVEIWKHIDRDELIGCIGQAYELVQLSNELLNLLTCKLVEHHIPDPYDG